MMLLKVLALAKQRRNGKAGPPGAAK